jgi:hypothetical protein
MPVLESQAKAEQPAMVHLVRMWTSTKESEMVLLERQRLVEGAPSSCITGGRRPSSLHRFECLCQ